MCDDCDRLWSDEWQETGTYLGGWDHYSTSCDLTDYRMKYVFHYDLFRCDTCKTIWMRDHQDPLHWIGGNVIWRKFVPAHERYLMIRHKFYGRP
jgi:hypothetical protein